MADEALKTIKFGNLPESRKMLMLELLGFNVDEEGFIIDTKKNDERVKCPYTHQFVQFKTASILPGSEVIMNTSPFTLSAYISEHLAGECQSDNRTNS